jgi:DNA-binding beta-propeller fold protein YncE
MKKQILLMFCLMLGLVNLAVAEEAIGVFANTNTNSIQYIDPATQAVSDSLLKGYLGTYGGGLFDLAITPNGKTAIVSNFGDSKIFFIDISGGFDAQPVLKGQTRIPFFAEDLAITPDGKYVLVTDGGFASRIAVVDIAGQYLVNNQNFGNIYSNAIAISPDGQNVLTADYFTGRISLFTIDEDGILTHVQTQNVLPARPVNVSISPDGKTAIGVSANGYYAPVFALGTGTMEFKGFVTMPYKTGQSCVFNNDGTKAYYLSNSIYRSGTGYLFGRHHYCSPQERNQPIVRCRLHCYRTCR